jgi:sugar phosphate isomerase/epimerase
MMKVGLYSVTYSGTWYAGKPLALKELVLKARQLGYQGIEIDLKRPHGFPLDLSAKDRSEIRSFAESQGIEIPAVAGNNNFASPIPEQRENELMMLHEQILLARDLGAPVLRVFAAWNGVTFRNGIAAYELAAEAGRNTALGATRLERWHFVRECLKEGAVWAEKHGVTMALQNHPPVMESYEDVLQMVAEVGSDRLQCCVDASNCGANQGDAYLAEAVRKTGRQQVHSHFSGEWQRDAAGGIEQFRYTPQTVIVNYPVFVRTLKQIGYGGFINYELCHPVLRRHDVRGLEVVDEQAALAVEYMKHLIASV